MKIYELMAMSAPLLRRLANEGILADDIKYLPLMLRYEELHGVKKTAIVNILASEFNLTERAIYKILSRLDKEA